MNILLRRIKLSKENRYIIEDSYNTKHKWALDLLLPGNSGSINADDLKLAVERAECLGWDIHVVDNE